MNLMALIGKLQKYQHTVMLTLFYFCKACVILLIFLTQIGSLQQINEHTLSIFGKID